MKKQGNKIEKFKLGITTHSQLSPLIQATSYEILIKCLKPSLGVFIPIPILLLRTECGCIKEYKTLKDIPKHSVKCKHNVYFIKFLKHDK